MLSDYLLLERISRGNVADVYRARQNNAGQYEVAVKIFRPGYAEREIFRAYFLYEAEKIGQFDHPHILPFIEYGEGQGLLYSVTPFVKSGTLEDLLKKVGGKFSAMQALPIVQQLCDAVQYAHEHDVTHGNIKPLNVFVANDGRMLLADFGIARGYADEQRTVTQLDWGAVQYGAPEQSLGLLRRSSDIYSLGALFFRVLTGSPVFSGAAPVEVLLKHVRQEPPSARTLEPDISDAVDEVLRKALSKRSDDRYVTAAELCRAFAAAVAVAPVASPVARAVNLATRSAISPPPDPQTPMPAMSMITPPPGSPVGYQSGATSVISLPPELMQQSAPQPPVLPEQHGNVAYPGQNAPPASNQAQGVSSHTRRSLEPVEWSPLAQSSASGGPINAADYLRSKPLAPRTAEPRPASKEEQASREKQAGKKGQWLPVLVIILLVLGLLGALLSPLLFSAHSSSGSGLRALPTIVAYQARPAPAQMGG